MFKSEAEPPDPIDYLLKLKVLPASQLRWRRSVFLVPCVHCPHVLCHRLPGDTRTKVGFITFDSTIHFYNLQEGLSQPQMLIVSDIEGEAEAKASKAKANYCRAKSRDGLFEYSIIRNDVGIRLKQIF